VDRDVEAPDVFSVTDMALWDGRPSLGGVWVASPDAVDPERVILRNPANGKFVIGALFRRERDNPGPALQISSDAAAALGLLAGQPGKIGVTALRREEAPLAAPDASRPILDAAETVATETLDPAPTVAPADGTASVAAAAEDKKPRGLGLFKKRQPKSDGPVAPVVSSETLGTETATAAPSSTVAPPPAPTAPPKGGLIQIGIFSVEANAKRAVDTLSKAGIAATIRQETAQGKAFWSVTATGGADSLAKVKAAGFADAYMLKRG
jgi:cell division septation protein DedD